ncbi:MAG TPA: DUF4382 domain-containing protein [Candidatus Acidoferrum sp.]|nr:DUF4382 domain-containing protein [Candidatus Acidoferrum sp.]
MNPLAIVGVLIVVIVIIGGAYYLTSMHGTSTVATTTVAAPSAQQAKTTWTVSDAPAASGITAVNIQVTGVEVKSSTSGQWYPVTFSTNGSYNLSALSGSYAIMGNVTVPAGTYSQVMMTIGSASVTANGTTQAAALANSTVLVSGNFDFTNTTNSTNWVNIGINSSESVHAAAYGSYAMYPTVQIILWQNAQLGVQSNNTVSVQNYGTVATTVNAGMALNGTMQSNFVLSQSLNLTVNPNGIISVGVG